MLSGALLIAQPAHAQNTRCAQGERTTGWIGLAELACNCTLTTSGVAPIWSFRSEPRVITVDRGSPADGQLRPADEIVAIDGELITTTGAGHRFGALTPGTPVRFTVRRDGRLTEVTVTPTAVCSGDARALPRLPRAPAPPEAPAIPRARSEAPPVPPVPPAAAPPAPTRTPPPPRAPAPPLPGILSSLAARDVGWFGFGITCRECSWDRTEAARPVWRFEENPRLLMVEEGSAAWAAGLRAGDELVRIDGVALVTAEGGRRFGAVRPGETVRWTYRRDGSERTVTLQAGERPIDPGTARLADMLDSLAARTRRGERVPADFLPMWERATSPGVVLPRTPAPDPFRSIRFRGQVGGVEVEVVGGPGVVTTIVEDGRDLIIDTGDARIRVRVSRAPA